MMKDIVICGAGGFAREVAWLIDNINAGKKLWNIIGFVESSPERKGVVVNDLPILGGDEFFEDYKKPVSVACAIGSGKIRKKIISGLSKFKNIDFPNLISPEIVFSEYNKMGQGCIICAGSIITVNIVFHDFVIVNLDCTIGHDAILESYVTLSPSVNVSGHVTIEECAEVGTGANIIHEKQIGENTIIGAGSVVVSDIPENSVAVGSPAKVIKNI